MTNYIEKNYQLKHSLILTLIYRRDGQSSVTPQNKFPRRLLQCCEALLRATTEILESNVTGYCERYCETSLSVTVNVLEGIPSSNQQKPQSSQRPKKKKFLKTLEDTAKLLHVSYCNVVKFLESILISRKEKGLEFKFLGRLRGVAKLLCIS